MSLIYQNLTNKIIRCIYDIHNEIGVGYDEETYHQGLIYLFQKQEIPFLSKQSKLLTHRETDVKTFEYDLLVFDKIILELKSIQSDFLQTHYVQIISYLKLWEIYLGLLVNFGLPRAKIKRILFTEKEKRVTEDYEYIKSIISTENRKYILMIRQALLNILDVHGLGYGEAIYRRMVEIELEYQKVTFEKSVLIDVMFENKLLRKQEINYFLIQNSIVLGVTALQNEITFYDIAKTKTYLKGLNLKIGIISNFGKNQLQVLGVSA